MVQTNYLKNTAPEVRTSFIKSFKRVPLFSQLSDKLLYVIFKYSKFIDIPDRSTLIQEGMFDQWVYILIEGRMDVFLKSSKNSEEKIDIIFKPFTLFGERSIIGEPQSVTVKSTENSFLVGIDLSSLPDVINGFENPNSRLDDRVYLSNISLYTVFTSVLIERLDRLIKDQYKLTQKINRLHNTHKIWKKNELMAHIFNEFSDGKLHPGLKVSATVKKVLRHFKVKSKALDDLLEKDFPDTAKIFLELVRLANLGQTKDIDEIIFTLVRQFTAKALDSKFYLGAMSFEGIAPPKITGLSAFLDKTWDSINKSNILAKEIRKEEFLKGFFSYTNLNPAQLVNYLAMGGWLTDQFSQAYLLVILCQCCIELEHEVNHKIAILVKQLKNLTASRQNTQTDKTNQQIQQSVKEFLAMKK